VLTPSSERESQYSNLQQESDAANERRGQRKKPQKTPKPTTQPKAPPRRPGADRTSGRILLTPVRNRSGVAVGPAARGAKMTAYSSQTLSPPQQKCQGEGIPELTRQSPWQQVRRPWAPRNQFRLWYPPTLRNAPGLTNDGKPVTKRNQGLPSEPPQHEYTKVRSPLYCPCQPHRR
jgi:hypothetical protein